MLLEAVKSYLNERMGSDWGSKASDFIEAQPRMGRNLVSFDAGFMTYELKGDACIIYDVYVEPQFRNKGIVKSISCLIADTARNNGKRVLIGLSGKEGQNRQPGLNVIRRCGGLKFLDTNKLEGFIKGV